MRQFYIEFRDRPILEPLVREISWAKNLLILKRCKDDIQREPTTLRQALPATGTDGRKKPLLKPPQRSVIGCHLMATNGNIVSVSTESENSSENEKTLEIIEKTRVFERVEDGTRTRDIRNHNPTL